MYIYVYIYILTCIHTYIYIYIYILYIYAQKGRRMQCRRRGGGDKKKCLPHVLLADGVLNEVREHELARFPIRNYAFQRCARLRVKTKTRMSINSRVFVADSERRPQERDPPRPAASRSPVSANLRTYETRALQEARVERAKKKIEAL